MRTKRKTPKTGMAPRTEETVSPKAYFDRGVAHAKSGDDEKAMEQFSKAISLDRQFVEAYIYRGILYCKNEEHGRAIADFETAKTLSDTFRDLCETLRDSGMLGLDDEENSVAITEALLSNPGLFGMTFEVAE